MYPTIFCNSGYRISNPFNARILTLNSFATICLDTQTVSPQCALKGVKCPHFMNKWRADFHKKRGDVSVKEAIYSNTFYLPWKWRLAVGFPLNLPVSAGRLVHQSVTLFFLSSARKKSSSLFTDIGALFTDYSSVLHNTNLYIRIYINPLLPTVSYMPCSTKISISFYEKIIKK